MKRKVLGSRTSFPAKGDVDRKWYVIDASDRVLGRLASDVARVLRGKHKPEFNPHSDVGDFVIVLNADKVRVTGRKPVQKKYYRHSGYPGGLKETAFDKLFAAKPEEVVRKAVRGMLPKTTLGRAMALKMKVYRGDEHPHEAQKPETFPERLVKRGNGRRED
jgi:large subunit ribosomal protein L13